MKLTLRVINRCLHTHFTSGCRDCERVRRLLKRVGNRMAKLQREAPLTRLTLEVTFTNPEYSITEEELNS